jgi:putative acetyltransferase
VSDPLQRPIVQRRIEPGDDAQVAALIRIVMPEFGASGVGFAIVDPEVDAMSAAYAGPRAGYWVLALGGRIVGGGGYAQLAGATADTCELRKMYFLPEVRGRGAGRHLLTTILQAAREDGFTRCYLETLRTMTAARRLYEAAGFEKLAAPEGATGHFGCDAWYARPL